MYITYHISNLCLKIKSLPPRHVQGIFQDWNSELLNDFGGASSWENAISTSKSYPTPLRLASITNGLVWLLKDIGL